MADQAFPISGRRALADGGMKAPARAYYAIGDVHGMAERLLQLHQAIRDDIAASGGPPATIVHLGDYIDRGPDSRGVIAAIIALETETAPSRGRYTIVNLRGNHEQMMLDALGRANPTARRLWTANGGDTTIESYRRARSERQSLIDLAHLRWLRRLPTAYRAPDQNLVFVHAGIDPELFPHCAEHVRMWTRSARFFDVAHWPDREALRSLIVVHGHTPTNDFSPDVTAQRINVDTGAVFGGPLTCVVLRPGDRPRFLYA